MTEMSMATTRHDVAEGGGGGGGGGGGEEAGI